ncbi:MAG: hypothetical protein WA715_07520 [Candidatus Acidiferrum sp.]|jgi:hypothetical protein
MIWARHLKLFSKLALAALAVGALATTAIAQTVYKGKFTLPFETHSGGTTLSAGDDAFTMASASFSYTLYIHGQAGDAIILAAAKQIHTGRREARQKAMLQTVPASQVGENAACIQGYSADR